MNYSDYMNEKITAELEGKLHVSICDQHDNIISTSIVTNDELTAILATTDYYRTELRGSSIKVNVMRDD